jgi:hypothetical protein
MMEKEEERSRRFQREHFSSGEMIAPIGIGGA